MKKLLILICLAGALAGAHAAKWETYTNTSHVYDLTSVGQDLYFSTWGGVVKLSAPDSNSPLASMQESMVWTTANGIGSNDVRVMRHIPSTGSLWIGSEYSGISIISPLGIQNLDESLGLPSNRVKAIVEKDSRILVATYAGMAEYYYLEGVNFPLLLHKYDTQNTHGALLSNEIDAMLLAENDYLYISSVSGINYVHLDSLAVDTSWHVLPAGPVPPSAVKKLSANAASLVISTPNGVYKRSIDPTQTDWQMILQTGVQLGNEPIAAVAIAEDGTLWISYGSWNEDFLTYTTAQGILLSSATPSGDVTHYYKNALGLLDKSVSSIYPAASGVFLGTWGDGLFHLEQGVFMRFLPNSIGVPKIRQIATDANNAAWFASGDYNTIPLRKSALGVSKFLDGEWHTYNTANSNIHSDNILTVAVDSHNRKWFGTYDVDEQSPAVWDYGLTVWDETTDIWKYITVPGTQTWVDSLNAWGPIEPGGATLLGNTISHISRDLNDNMIVSCFDRGVSVIGPNDQLAGSFTIPNSVYQRVSYSYHNGRQYFIGTYNDRGLMIWNHDSIPVTGGEHWVQPPMTELNNCEVFGVVTIESPYEGIQHWIAVSNGLYMWDETYWYKYDTSIKRFRYNTASGVWDQDLLYYVDEERLYGSVRTTPTAIYLDPFGRIWIGSLANGISMYDPTSERFTNYYQSNSPLLSNYITALGYEPVEGRLLIGTPDGLNTLKIGRVVKPNAPLAKLVAFPNPFKPDLHGSVQIANQPSDLLPAGTAECRIFDAAGMLVITLQENEFSRFRWNGENKAGRKCASGTYFYVVADDAGNIKRGSLVLIR